MIPRDEWDVVIRPSTDGDTPDIARLALMASTAYDAFVFSGEEERLTFTRALLMSGHAEFSPRHSYVADSGGRTVGLLSMLSSDSLRAVRMKLALWLARDAALPDPRGLLQRMQIAGSAGLRPERADMYISRIAADPTGGRGIGSALLSFALDRTRELGATRLVLDVSSDNSRAVEFYRRHGFKEIGSAKALLPNSGVSLTNIHMGRHVDDERPIPEPVRG